MWDWGTAHFMTDGPFGPQPYFSIINTTILVLSSVTCQFGVFKAEKGIVKRTGSLFNIASWGLREWYTLTFVMGSIFIGGVAGYSRAHLTASGSSGTPAVIAPGTIDSVTGAHVLGTLSVGSTAQTTNVTFGANSRLVVSIGKEEAVDQLVVQGMVDLSSTSDGLALTVDPEAKAGTYVLVSASGGVIGTFNTPDVPKPALLTYTATSVEYTVPPSATLIIVR